MQRLRERRRERRARAAEPMSLVDHLTELRTRIIIAAIAVAVGGVVGFLLYTPVLDLLQRPYCDIQPDSCQFVVTDPLESFSIRLKLSAYIGLLLASPVVLWQLWRFITPGLYEREKRYAVPFVASGVVLFLIGAGLAFVIFPQALRFLEGIGGDEIRPLYTPGKYLSLILFMMLAFGIGFEFPIVLVFLQMAGVVGWRRLASWRRYAFVLIFVFDAVITPSGDPISLLAMAVPMCLFYEASILIGRFVIRKP
ncbi:MAG TPA: twin-arginine translocase subunit TatC [Acidimicrobiales bacterium]|nr:twin-arginine translocase subunit TatC [Acidimicrobiales bacterium]